MQKSITKLTHWPLLILLLIAAPIPAIAAQPRTDAVIQNYSKDTITVEYRIMGVGGVVSWRKLGDISKRKAKTFRNVTIGSVIRARAGNRVLDQFSVSNPPPGKSQVVLRVR